MRALVTGGAGFAGRHLLDALCAAGHEAHGAGLPHGAGEPAPAGAGWHDLDVTDAAACRALLGALAPDWLFHLAGFAHVGKAEQAAEACLAVNFGGSRAVLEGCLLSSSRTHVLLVSSAEVYGHVPQSALPVTEEAPLAPATAYAVSKAAAEMAAHHARARGLRVTILRPFNHVGPGQSPDFAASAFAQQVARIEQGLQPPVLQVGNLEARRDLCDVRDTVAGYLAAAQAGRAGATYNVCSGRALAVRDVLSMLLELAGVPIRVETDPARLRPVDLPVFLGSGERLFRDTGFRPQRPLAGALRDVLDYFRARAAEERVRR